MTRIVDFNQSSNSVQGSGILVTNTFNPYTIEIPIPFNETPYPNFSVFTKSVYGIIGDSLGFGDGGFGVENYIKLEKFNIEFDFVNMEMYLIVPDDYKDDYSLEIIDDKRYKLNSINTDYEFLIITN